MPEELTFGDRFTGFLNEHPILGGLIASTPMGGRVMSALGQLAGIQYRKQQMAQQQALEGQLGTLAGFESNPDPEAGITGLEGYAPPGLRPQAAQHMIPTRKSLVTRAADIAAARSRVQTAPEVPAGPSTFQSFGYSPDRAERGGPVPPPNVSLRDYEGVAPADAMARFSALRMPSPLSADRSGSIAVTDATIPGSPAIPAQYRLPQSRAEMVEGMTEKERRRFYEAYGLHAMPPDMAVSNAADARARIGHTNNPETLDALGKLQASLDAWRQGLAPEDQTPENLQNYEGTTQAIAVAKQRPNEINNAFAQHKATISGVTDRQKFRSTEARLAQESEDRKVQWIQLERQFNDTNARMSKTANAAQAERDMNNLEQALKAMAVVLKDAERQVQGDPTKAAAAEALKLRFMRLQGAYYERLNMLSGSPEPPPKAAGGGPVPPPGNPAVAPGRTPPPTKAGPETRTLKDGSTVTREVVP